MGLYIRQDQGRTELQKRIAAELQDKAKNRQDLADLPDGVDDSQYIKGTTPTSRLAIIWLILAVLVIGVVLWLVIATTGA